MFVQVNAAPGAAAVKAVTAAYKAGHLAVSARLFEERELDERQLYERVVQRADITDLLHGRPLFFFAAIRSGPVPERVGAQCDTKS